MKRILKYFGMTMGILILVLIAIGLYIGANDIPTYEIEKIEFSAVTTPEALERGKKLTTMLCANCHMDKSSGKLTGTRMLDAPPEFGEIYSQNITQDENVGIGSWTDAELLYLLRTGIKKDGQYSPPYMAKLPVMADEDLNAIIAFLRSDDPLVNPDPT
ncbi:MAG: cytochrome c, partial [Muriicola sp.]|nr:cytochrome c [Muriicola sp.]NNK34677.1 c-type cytochrome [Eudoraea sp.]